MNKDLLLGLAIGAGLGAFATWYFVKKKYELIAQEEIDSVKEAFSRHYKKDLDTPYDEDNASSECDSLTMKKTEPEHNYTHYESIIKQNNYTNDENEVCEPMYEPMTDRPYVISPDEFGDIDEYETISLTYYLDGILTDDDDVPIEDADDVIGLESLNHFGEFEDDSVFVRNDTLKSDYEILLDQRNYSDLRKPF